MTHKKYYVRFKTRPKNFIYATQKLFLNTKLVVFYVDILFDVSILFILKNN